MRRPTIVLFGIVIALTATAVATAAPPANDDFAAAQTLTGEPGTAAGTNVDATAETGEPGTSRQAAAAPRGRGTGPPPSPRSVVEMHRASRHVLAVYTGGSVAALTSSAASDDACGTYGSRVGLRAREPRIGSQSTATAAPSGRSRSRGDALLLLPRSPSGRASPAHAQRRRHAHGLVRPLVRRGADRALVPLAALPCRLRRDRRRDGPGVQVDRRRRGLLARRRCDRDECRRCDHGIGVRRTDRRRSRTTATCR